MWFGTAFSSKDGLYNRKKTKADLKFHSPVRVYNPILNLLSAVSMDEFVQLLERTIWDPYKLMENDSHELSQNCSFFYTTLTDYRFHKCSSDTTFCRHLALSE